MIILHDTIFGYVNTIIFQLTERIALDSKSCEAVSEVRRDMLAFAYSALPTRHTVRSKPMSLKENMNYMGAIKINARNKRNQN